MDRRWPWSLNPLDARIVAAWFVGWAGWAGGMYFSKSWEEIRLGMQLNILFGVAILGSIVGFWSEFDFSQFTTRSYGLGALVLTAALAYFYWRQERTGRG
jgi:hypothetical protein